MIRILTYGTFDLLHIGHLRLLERLAALGDELYVGVSTDEFNDEKGKRCVMPFQDRLRLVGALRCVTRVFPERHWTQKPFDVRRLQADVLGMGDDWAGHFDSLNAYCQVVYLPRTEGVSTTYLREEIHRRAAQRAMAV